MSYSKTVELPGTMIHIVATRLRTALDGAARVNVPCRWGHPASSLPWTIVSGTFFPDIAKLCRQARADACAARQGTARRHQDPGGRVCSIASVATMHAPLTPRNWNNVEAEYARASRLQHVVIDDFLTPDACAELHGQLLRHPGWNLADTGADSAYLAGRDAPELAAIGTAVLHALPTVLAGMELVEHWVLLHRRSSGLGPHFDAGAVNVNLWLTPDEHNLTPGRAGLVLYGVQRPEELSADDIKLSGWAREFFAREHDGTEVQIPYRCNRALLFRSALFHASDEGSFRASDPPSCRMNLTLLFEDPNLYATRHERFGYG
jgi:hypothetical protein